MLHRLAANPARGKLIINAVAQMGRRGAVGIFLTRWLFAPVGPWANFAAGATRDDYTRFTIPAIAGEAVWVALYVLMGDSFAGNIQAASGLAGSALGIVAGVAAMLGSGYWLAGSMRPETAGQPAIAFASFGNCTRFNSPFSPTSCPANRAAVACTSPTTAATSPG